MMLGYRIDVTPDDNGTVLITAPSLPEVTTFSEPRGFGPVLAARAAIGEALAGRIARGADIPPSDPDVEVGEPAEIVYVDPLVEAKVELYRAIRAKGMTRAELQRQLGWNGRESVDRLFRLDHASKLDHINTAFRALGKNISIRVVESPRIREVA